MIDVEKLLRVAARRGHQAHCPDCRSGEGLGCRGVTQTDVAIASDIVNTTMFVLFRSVREQLNEVTKRIQAEVGDKRSDPNPELDRPRDLPKRTACWKAPGGFWCFDSCVCTEPQQGPDVPPGWMRSEDGRALVPPCPLLGCVPEAGPHSPLCPNRTVEPEEEAALASS